LTIDDLRLTNEKQKADAGFSRCVVVGLARHPNPTKVGHYKLKTTDEIYSCRFLACEKKHKP